MKRIVQHVNDGQLTFPHYFRWPSCCSLLCNCHV